MILHLMIVDDEEDVLESLVPGFVSDLARNLLVDPAVQKANAAAGSPLPKEGRLNVKVSAVGYQSAKVAKYAFRRPAHLHVTLCCEKGGSFRHALRLLKEQFFAVVVSDLRFADDAMGSRAGRLFIDDVCRRNPATFGILYSAYQRPEGFPAERFVRKGAASNLDGAELVDKVVEGVAGYLAEPSIQRFSKELARRGLVYQSDEFGAMLRRLYDYAGLYFGPEPVRDDGRRRPRPTLLIDGETGVGKTELAGLLHRVSDRRDEPFVAATCNQLTNETFLRSILFGHVRGSFTGGTADRPGMAQAAGSGVLLLDDLHKLNDACSVILHSFLDDGAYSHLGEDEVRRQAHCAVVCTVETPRWEEQKSDGGLSESFVNRVEQLVLRVPPLRARADDIEYQAQRYCVEQCQRLGIEAELSREALAWLTEFGFPGGNSRKLRDFIHGLVTANARVTDYLDQPEVEEHARETGLLGRRKSAEAASAAPPAAKPAAAPVAANPWTAGEPTGDWPARIVRLAGKALVEDLGLDADAADGAVKALFLENFPKLWAEFLALTRRPDPGQAMEIKLFDELLRYYAIYRQGSPAKAAKELGIKDNALREFVYSREAKRIGGKRHKPDNAS